MNPKPLVFFPANEMLQTVQIDFFCCCLSNLEDNSQAVSHKRLQRSEQYLNVDILQLEESSTLVYMGLQETDELHKG